MPSSRTMRSTYSRSSAPSLLPAMSRAMAMLPSAVRGRQQIELLEDKANLRLAHAGARRIRQSA